MDYLRTLIDGDGTPSTPVVGNSKRIQSVLTKIGYQLASSLGFKSGSKRELDDQNLSASNQKRRTRSLSPPRFNVTPQSTPTRSLSTVITPSSKNSSMSSMTGISDNSIGANNAFRPSINFLGYRKLATAEKLNLGVGTEIIFVLPLFNKNNSSNVEDFRKRLHSLIVKSRCDEFRRTPSLQRPHLLESIIDANHRIKRGGTFVYEFVVTISNYANRCYFLDPNCRKDYIRDNYNQGGGIELFLENYDCNNSVLCKFSEMRYVEMWKAHYRHDSNTAKLFSGRKRKLENYVNELETFFAEVEHDVIQTFEVLTLFHETKSRCLKADLSRAMTASLNASITAPTSDALNSTNITDTLNSELDEKAMTDFAKVVDDEYLKAIKYHYIGFNKLRGGLLTEECRVRLFNTLQESFPILTEMFGLIVMTKKNLFKSNEDATVVVRKRITILNYVCALFRLRNSNRLKHWALVGTLAMHGKGVSSSAHRSPIFKSFSTTLQTALNTVGTIYEGTKYIRLELLTNQPYLLHVLDNYQRTISKTFQTNAMASIVHRGTVFSAIRVKVFELPIESVIQSPAGKLFVVTKCERQSAYLCIVSCKEKDDATDATLVHMDWPSIGWVYSSVPGLEVQPPLTYIDQKFPSPLHLRGPLYWSDDRILLNSRKYNDISCESFSTKRYYDLILSQEQYMDLINFDHKTQLDPSVASLSNGDDSISHSRNESSYEYKLVLLNNLFRNQQSSLNSVKYFQNDFLKMMNSTHTAVDEFILFPLCPRDEISYSGVLLTSINISRHLGLIEETSNAKFKPSKNAHLRTIFQFGDVLTDERMANIDLRVLSHLTKIGHEDYVRVIYNSTKTYIKQHDYLHEIIHYLSTVFKVDYPGFLQPIQVLIGTKRIQIDPTKGKWRDHEYFIEKVLSACKHLRLVSFFRHHDQLFNSPLTGGELVSEIKRKYNNYCKMLDVCPCEISRRVSLFIKRAQSWRRASDGVRKGDFILLEEETARWIPVWKKSKKPYYYKAGLRRLETMNAMSPPEMELMRRNRFVRMSAGKHFISVDDFCEKHNLMQKDVTENDVLDNVVEQSKHLHLFRRCGDELFGVTHHKSTTIPSRRDDVSIIVSFLEKVGVFEHFSVSNKLNDNTFWEHVEVRKTGKGGASDVSKGTVALDAYEENCRAVLLSWKDQVQSIPYKENNHAEDETMLLGDADTGYIERITANDFTESDNENITDDICQDIGPDETRIPTVLTTVEEQTAVLKKLCKVHRYKTNDECLRDLYDGGVILMENVVAEQDTLHATIKREENLIHKAVSFFCERMKTNMDEIKKIVEVAIQQKDEEIILSQWEVDYIKWSNEINP